MLSKLSTSEKRRSNHALKTVTIRKEEIRKEEKTGEKRKQERRGDHHHVLLLLIMSSSSSSSCPSQERGDQSLLSAKNSSAVNMWACPKKRTMGEY